MSWTEISKLLMVHPETARLICKRARENAPGEKTTRDLYTALEGQKRPGKPEIIPPESQVSTRLKEVALQDQEHREKKWVDIADEVGIVASRTTIERVMHNQHHLGRFNSIVKPPLDRKNKEKRLELVDRAIGIPANCWIFSDECFIEVNAQSKNRHGRITRPVGSNPYDYAHHRVKEPAGAKFMIWSCISFGYRGPLFIWEKETNEERQFYDDIVNRENNEKKERQITQQRLATQPGTEEYRILSDINEHIKQLDQASPLPSSRSRQKRRAE
ncbi:hypothetical protein P167DRAFT_579187 [Morchella conica CCBAS932]|uniref:Transposase Tc1-like domain-containing protein n=1 Tax=Morchella conica CCBAS932 TaxID=1392247 RepID=A0A3N4KAG8_9PEZI|nr:hypothetical protein P167DRAFT_579187 [Morchella conica CCBAS932]